MNRADHIEDGWTQVGAPYFKRATDYFNSKYPRLLLIVLSGEIPWCRANIVGNRVVYS